MSPPKVIESILQRHQLLPSSTVVEHVLTNELGKITHILNADRLIEHGHWRAGPQIHVHKKHRLQLFVVCGERIKGREIALLYDFSDFIGITQVIEIILNRQTSFLDDMNFLDFAGRGAPKNLSQSYVAFVSLIVKPSEKDRIALTRLPQRFLTPLPRLGIMDFGISPKDVITLIALTTTGLTRGHVVITYTIGNEERKESVHNSGLSRTITPRDHRSATIRLHRVDGLVESAPIQ